MDGQKSSLDSLDQVLAVLQREVDIPLIGAQKVVGCLLVSPVARMLKVGHDSQQQNLFLWVK